MILDNIIERKKAEVVRHKELRPLETFQSAIRKSTRDFKAALSERGMGLIAEIKKKSPSENVIIKSLSFDEIAIIYEQNSFVKALSILTDFTFFGGNLELLRKAESLTSKPLLRKDFIIDEYQIYESRFFGADAVLLIARILERKQIQKFIDIAADYDMNCLIEIHNENEIEKLPENIKILGVNNRNLDTLKVTLDTTLQIFRRLRMRAEILVTESGIHNLKDVRKVEKAADAMLIGTSILKSADINKKIDSFFRPRVKICGITNFEDARLAAELGADFLGFIFYDKSPRYVDPETVRAIIRNLKGANTDIRFVGVFVNESPEEINRLQEFCKFDIIQLHGEESESTIKLLNNPVIKAFRIKDETDVDIIGNFESEYILLDSFQEGEYGGTGKVFDWSIIDKIDGRKIFLAGGVTPDNFHSACEVLPYAIDISSGVEISYGKKDKEKLTRIFRME